MRHLFVLPTVETVDLLQKMFQASPMAVDFDKLGVSLGSSM